MFDDHLVFCAGDYVAVMYGKSWFPGKIVTLHENASADISCMKYADHFQQDNRFR